MSKILIKNIISGEVQISDIGKRLKPGKSCEVPGVSSVNEAMNIPTIKLHVMRGRLEIFADKKVPKTSKEPKADKKEVKAPKESADLKQPKSLKPPVTRPKKIYTKMALEAMKMDKLRKIGKPLGAKDTKKSELINEILKAQKKG